MVGEGLKVSTALLTRHRNGKGAVEQAAREKETDCFSCCLFFLLHHGPPYPRASLHHASSFERIGDGQSLDLLSVGQVFGIERFAAGLNGSRND